MHATRDVMQAAQSNLQQGTGAARAWGSGRFRVVYEQKAIAKRRGASAFEARLAAIGLWGATVMRRWKTKHRAISPQSLLSSVRNGTLTAQHYLQNRRQLERKQRAHERMREVVKWHENSISGTNKRSPGRHCLRTLRGPGLSRANVAGRPSQPLTALFGRNLRVHGPTT